MKNLISFFRYYNDIQDKKVQKINKNYYDLYFAGIGQ